MLNIDEILRLSSTKLLVILRGNKPLLLDKMIYTEHPLAKKLKNSSIYDYNPNWTKNNTHTEKIEKPKMEEKNVEKKKEKLSFDTF